MPSLSPERRRARSRIANLSKPEVDASPEELEDAKRDYKALSAEEYVRALLDKPPALRPEQIARLSAMLAPHTVDAP